MYYQVRNVCYFFKKLYNYFIMLQIIWSIGQPSLVRSHAYDLDLLYFIIPIPQTQVQKKIAQYLS